jgi:hypothetical protein
VTIRFFVTSLTKAHSPNCSGLGVPNFLHLRMMEVTVLGERQCCRLFLVPFPRSVPRNNPVSFMDNSFVPVAWFLLKHALSTVGPYIKQVCAFPNHVHAIEFTIGGLQSSSRNISRMINGNKMHRSSIASLIAKGRNVCLIKTIF